jgi:hypothetical protein
VVDTANVEIVSRAGREEEKRCPVLCGCAGLYKTVAYSAELENAAAREDVHPFARFELGPRFVDYQEAIGAHDGADIS